MKALGILYMRSRLCSSLSLLGSSRSSRNSRYLSSKSIIVTMPSSSLLPWRICSIASTFEFEWISTFESASFPCTIKGSRVSVNPVISKNWNIILAVGCIGAIRCLKTEQRNHEFVLLEKMQKIAIVVVWLVEAGITIAIIQTMQSLG